MAAASRLSMFVLFAAAGCLPLSCAVHLGDPHHVGHHFQHLPEVPHTSAQHRNEEQHSVEVKHAKDDASANHKDNDEATGHVELSASKKEETKKHLSVSSLTKEQKKQAKEETKIHLSVSSLTKEQKKQAKEETKKHLSVSSLTKEQKKQAKETNEVQREDPFKLEYDSPAALAKKLKDFTIFPAAIKEPLNTAVNGLAEGVPVCLEVSATSSTTRTGLGLIMHTRGACNGAEKFSKEVKVPGVFGIGGGTMSVALKSGDAAVQQ